MFSRIISSLGIQGIQVNTHLHTAQLFPGQNVQGQIHFQGASSNKTINGIYLRLMTLVEVESGDHEKIQEFCIAQWHMSGAFQLLAHQTHNIPFNIQLPFETPVTQIPCHRNNTRVWLHTQLDVNCSLNATDRDYIQISPTPIMQTFLAAMQQCGYQLISTDVERGQLHGGHFHSSIGCYQEMEFKPLHWGFNINEIEVSFITETQQTHILLEFDRKLRGDRYHSLTLHHQHYTPEQLAAQIQQLIR